MYTCVLCVDWWGTILYSRVIRCYRNCSRLPFFMKEHEQNSCKMCLCAYSGQYLAVFLTPDYHIVVVIILCCGNDHPLHLGVVVGCT